MSLPVFSELTTESGIQEYKQRIIPLLAKCFCFTAIICYGQESTWKGRWYPIVRFLVLVYFLVFQLPAIFMILNRKKWFLQFIRTENDKCLANTLCGILWAALFTNFLFLGMTLIGYTEEAHMSMVFIINQSCFLPSLLLALLYNPRHWWTTGAWKRNLGAVKKLATNHADAIGDAIGLSLGAVVSMLLLKIAGVPLYCRD